MLHAPIHGTLRWGLRQFQRAADGRREDMMPVSRPSFRCVCRRRVHSMEDSAMTSRNRWIRSGLIAAAGLLFAWSYATAGEGKEKKFHARLDGEQETPAISTAGAGTFEATLNQAGDQLSF